MVANTNASNAASEDNSDLQLRLPPSNLAEHSFKSQAQRDKIRKKRAWRNIKQILTTMRSTQWQSDAVLFDSIRGPPSLRPLRKHSDITFLSAPYTDPHTKIRYHDATEFATIRSLNHATQTAYLALRGANVVLK